MNASQTIERDFPSACEEAKEWLKSLGDVSLEEAWRVCQRADWMLWLVRVSNPEPYIWICADISRILAAQSLDRVKVKHTLWEVSPIVDSNSARAVVYAAACAADAAVDAAADTAAYAVADAASYAADSADAATHAADADAAAAATYAADAADYAAYAADAADAAYAAYAAANADLVRERISFPLKG